MERESFSESLYFYTKRVLDMDPGHVEASWLRGRYFWKKRNILEAAESVAAAVRKHPGDGEAQANLGRIFFMMMRFQEAEDRFLRARTLGAPGELAREGLSLTGFFMKWGVEGKYRQAFLKASAALEKGVKLDRRVLLDLERELQEKKDLGETEKEESPEK